MNATTTTRVRATATVPGEALIKSFERHLRAEGKRQQTIDHYVGATRQFAAFCQAENLPDLTEITREHVELWLERLYQTYKPHSVRNRFVGLRIFLRWLLAEDEITRDPTARIRPPAVEEVQKDIVSPEDMARVLAWLEKQKRWRDAALVGVLYDTGMRAGELADCRLENVDLDDGRITIPTSKNHRIRRVRLSPAGVRFIDRYLRHRPKDPEWLLEGTRGKLTRSGVYQIVREIFEQAGVKGTIGAHDLRHTSATHAADVMSERDMMTLYGWTDSEMARHYARTALEGAAFAAHDRASPLSRLPKVNAKAR